MSFFIKIIDIWKHKMYAMYEQYDITELLYALSSAYSLNIWKNVDILQNESESNRKALHLESDQHNLNVRSLGLIKKNFKECLLVDLTGLPKCS